MFQIFAMQLRDLNRAHLKVLELGSGPGFLAQFLLNELPDIQLTLLDFSQPMHELARARLGLRASTVCFMHRDFKESDWAHGLAMFDAVVTNQAVHELRHKRYAPKLHSQVALLLNDGGAYFVCDHFFGAGGMSNNQLFMSIEEQQEALASAGFRFIHQVGHAGTLVMHRAA